MSSTTTTTTTTLSASPSFTSAVLADCSQQINQLRQEVAAQRLELASLRLQFSTFVKDEETRSLQSISEGGDNNDSFVNVFMRYLSCCRNQAEATTRRRRRNLARPSLFLRVTHPNQNDSGLGESDNNRNSTKINGEGADSAIVSPIATPTLRLNEETSTSINSSSSSSSSSVIYSNPLSAISINHQ
jgi:hypothetical protein